MHKNQITHHNQIEPELKRRGRPPKAKRGRPRKEEKPLDTLTIPEKYERIILGCAFLILAKYATEGGELHG
jgi:hypothetical protein